MTTSDERADRYIDVCLTVARTLLEMSESPEYRSMGGVPRRHLERRLAEQEPEASRAHWFVESGALYRTIRRDLQAPVVALFQQSSHDGSGGIPRDRKSLVRDPSLLDRQVASVDIELSEARLLEGIRELSFADQPPDYLPRDRVTPGNLNDLLNGDSTEDESFFREAYDDIRRLHDKGLIRGGYFTSDFRVRISLAGLIWLRERDRALTEEMDGNDSTRILGSASRSSSATSTVIAGSFGAQVFPIMLAGPSDASGGIQAARNAIDQWNAIHARDDQVVLVPMHWSRDASPGMGMPAQARIHELLSDHASALIAIFSQRLGTPTDDAVSGTASEINRFAQNGKPVHTYFSSQSVSLATAESEEFRRLREFQKELAKDSLQERYGSDAELELMLAKNIGMIGRDFIRKLRANALSDPEPDQTASTASSSSSDLIVELIARADQEGYPVLQRASPDDVGMSSVARELSRRFEDNDIHQVRILIENTGTTLVKDFQQRWVPFGMLTLMNTYEFGFVQPQPLPYASLLRPGQQLTARLWVSLMMLMSFGQTRDEQNFAPEGSWRAMGVLVYNWSDALGRRFEEKHKLWIRSGGTRSLELRLEPTTDG